MRYKIGVIGSAGRGKKLSKKILQKAREVGRAIAKNDCILITGACMGVPHETTIGAGEKQGVILGFSPAATLKEHLEPPISYPAPTKNTILIFTGFGKEGRNVLAIRTCDAVIIIAGHSGTLNEFAIAYQLGKVIGLLTETGGITKKLLEITTSIKKDTGALIISGPEPKKLVRKVINILKQRK